MIHLHGKLCDFPLSDREPAVLRVESNCDLSVQLRAKSCLIVADQAACERPKTDGFGCVLAAPGTGQSTLPRLPTELGHLTSGDVVRVNFRAGEIRVLYRRHSRHNSFLLTERCNSKCIMCSQPPRMIDDRFHAAEILETLALASPETPELGITGGEPTLYFPELLQIIRTARDLLPSTALHVLTNGRLFSYYQNAGEIAKERHPDLVLGIPLYSSVSAEHDYVVQARGAFEQTLRGIMNLARCRVPVEIRIVAHRDTYRAMPELARFIGRSLPFVKHVAIMGLELMGFAKSNLGRVWIDPTEYQDELEEAVRELTWSRVPTYIYNHQLCVLRPRLWRYSVQSISDWKNEFFEVCDHCAVRRMCGGFFSSHARRYSDGVASVSEAHLAEFVRQDPEIGLLVEG